MKYEIMFIVRPDMEEKNLKDVITSFENVLTSDGGKILSSKNMGQRELAYDIKKHKRGVYYLYQVEAPIEVVNEFTRLASISEDLIRHLVTKIED